MHCMTYHQMNSPPSPYLVSSPREAHIALHNLPTAPRSPLLSQCSLTLSVTETLPPAVCELGVWRNSLRALSALACADSSLCAVRLMWLISQQRLEGGLSGDPGRHTAPSHLPFCLADPDRATAPRPGRPRERRLRPHTPSETQEAAVQPAEISERTDMYRERIER